MNISSTQGSKNGNADRMEVTLAVHVKGTAPASTWN